MPSEIPNLSKSFVRFSATETIPDDVVSVDLSNNELQTLTNFERLLHAKELCLSGNRLFRLVSISRLTNLEVLDLSSNQISNTDGLNALINLRWLNLDNNLIQKFCYLDKLQRLAFLSIINNKLVSIPNLSRLFMLETVLLDENKISSLESCSQHLPVCCLKMLGLSRNRISDCTQASFLSGLLRLQQLSFAQNPCFNFSSTLTKNGFNYRPYLLCCCPSLKTIDGFVVTETEALKGEWLYCQGRGRHFLPGQHTEASEYLASVCPLSDLPGSLTTEDELKLKTVLAKRQQLQSADEAKPATFNSATFAGHRTSTPLNQSVQRLTGYFPAAGACAQAVGEEKTEAAGSSTKDHGLAFNPNSSDAGHTVFPCDEDVESVSLTTSTTTAIASNLTSPFGSSKTMKDETCPRRQDAASVQNQYDAYEARPVAAAIQSPFRSCSSASEKFPSSSRHRAVPASQRNQHVSIRATKSPFKRTKSTPPKPTASSFNNNAIMSCSFDDETSFYSQISCSSQSSRAQRRRWESNKSPAVIKSVQETPTNSPRTASKPNTAHVIVYPQEFANKSALIAEEQQRQAMGTAARRIQALWRGYICRKKDPDIQRVYAEIRWRRTEARTTFALEELKKCQAQLKEEKQLTTLLTEMVRRLYTDIQDLKQWRLESSESAQNIQTVTTCSALNVDSADASHVSKQTVEADSAWIAAPPTEFSFVWKDDSSGILSWKPPVHPDSIKGYEVYFNGELHGAVVGGKQYRVLLAELDIATTHRVTMKCLFTNGLVSKMSEPIIIQRPDVRVQETQATESRTDNTAFMGEFNIV